MADKRLDSDELTEAELEALTAPDADSDEAGDVALVESDSPEGADSCDGDVVDDIAAYSDPYKEVPEKIRGSWTAAGMRRRLYRVYELVLSIEQVIAADLVGDYFDGTPQEAIFEASNSPADTIVQKRKVESGLAAMKFDLRELEKAKNARVAAEADARSDAELAQLAESLRAQAEVGVGSDTSAQESEVLPAGYGEVIDPSDEAERERKPEADEVNQRSSDDKVVAPLLGEQLLATFMLSEGEDPNGNGVLHKFAMRVRELTPEQCDNLVREIVKWWATSKQEPMTRMHFTRVIRCLMRRRNDYIQARTKITSLENLIRWQQNKDLLSNLLLDGWVSVDEYMSLDLLEGTRVTRAWLNRHIPRKVSDEDKPKEKSAEETPPSASDKATDEPVEETPSVSDVVVVVDDTPGPYDQDAEVDVAQVEQPEDGVEDTPPVADDDLSGQDSELSDDSVLLAELDKLLASAKARNERMEKAGFRA